MSTTSRTTNKGCAAIALLVLWAGRGAADPPPPPPSLKPRMDAAVAWGRTHGAWQRSLVMGAISGSQSEVHYYAFSDPADLPYSNWAFRIGSITKTMTATALALQDRQGMRVGACGAMTVPTLLRDKLAESCPSCDPLPWPRSEITISQLATHHSGLPKRSTATYCSKQGVFESLSRCDLDPSGGGPDCSEGQMPAAKEDCARLPPDCACHDPGDEYNYSNWAFATLGHLLADNAGFANWRELDRVKVLEPLGMTHTKVNGESFAGLNKAPTSSCTAAGCVTVSEKPYPAASNPGGGLWSTGPDMLKYLRYAMNQPAATPSPEADALYQARGLIFCRRAQGKKNYDDSSGWMGLGWNQNSIGPSESGAPPTADPDDMIWWKGGDASTFHAYIAFSPSKNTGVFVLSNTDHPEGAGPDDIGRHFLRAF